MIRPFVAALAAVVIGGPAAAYTTRYEVQHYPVAFTRTVDQALGTNVENYVDGSVTLGFGTTPSPLLTIAAVRNTAAAGNFLIEDDYSFAVTVTPLSDAAKTYFATVAQRPKHIHISTAAGKTVLTETRASGSRISGYVNSGSSFASFGCDNGVGATCGTTHYRLAMFLDNALDNPYLCTAHGCPVVALGTGITFGVAISATLGLSADAVLASLIVDPTVALDPDFLSSAGLTARDFAVTPETGFGNTAASVPEPAQWAMLLAGFVFVGGAMRYRQPVAA